MKTCLIWDFDHTLVYRDGMWTQSIVNVMENNGYINVNKDSVHTFFKGKVFPWDRYEEHHEKYFNGLNWWEYVNEYIIKKAFVIAGANEKEIRKLIVDFRPEYLRREAWFLYEDTVPALTKSIEKGYENVVLSNHVPELEKLIQYLNLDKYFKKIYNSANIGYEKPNVNIFKYVINDLKYDRYIMIGDNLKSDIQGAKNAGIEGILVRKPCKNIDVNYAHSLNDIWKYL